MSKIPVEKERRGMPWWAWLLIALAVIGVIWLLWALLTGPEVEAFLAPTFAALLIPSAPRIDHILIEAGLKEVEHGA